MALGQAAKISLSQHNLAPQNTQENAQLTARGCLGRAKPWEPRKNLFQRSPALPLPHQPLLPCTSQPPSLGISWQHHPRLAAPPQTSTARAIRGRLPQASPQRSLGFIFIYYYSLLLFIYSLLFLFRFEHAQLCHLGFAENVNKKKAAFKCGLSLPEYVSHPTQLPCSHPRIRT